MTNNFFRSLERISFTNLDVTGPAIKVHVEVLDLAKLAEHVLDVLLARLLVHVRSDDDPALNAAHGGCVLGGARVQARGRLLVDR